MPVQPRLAFVRALPWFRPRRPAAPASPASPRPGFPARIAGATILTLTAQGTALAGTAEAPPPPAAGTGSPVPFHDKLTGDWGGLRDRLADRGIAFDVILTGFEDGLLAGDGRNDSWNLGGRVDASLRIDAEKLGLWQGGGFQSHVESRFGGAPAFRGGALWPVNTGLAVPLGDDDLAATSLFLTQRLGSSGLLMLGKINAFDLLAADPFFGGGGRDRFHNVAFVAPPSGVVPPTIMGAVLTWKAAPFNFTLMAFDPKDRTTSYWPDDLFDSGVNLSLGAAWAGHLAGRATSFSLTGTLSTADKTDLAQFLLPAELATGSRSDSWNIALGASHLLIDRGDGKGLGFYARASLADGNPNPIEAYLIGGFAAHGIIPGRPRDVCGLGAFFYDFSDTLQNAVAPLVTFDDEVGFEAFYNFAVTPWFRVTADVQVVDPANGTFGTAVVAGLRASVAF